MTELIEIELPKLGESILSAKIVQWLKKEGDFIEENEPLVEVTTDKVNSEIPSSCK
jgi:pyruvate/2-oxoglutarate dehydrogenase complex dihydrolipoamide acyltransferase (E2) component